MALTRYVEVLKYVALALEEIAGKDERNMSLVDLAIDYGKGQGATSRT